MNENMKMWGLGEFLKNLNKLNSFKNVKFEDKPNRILILSVIFENIVYESYLLCSKHCRTLYY